MSLEDAKVLRTLTVVLVVLALLVLVSGRRRDGESSGASSGSPELEIPPRADDPPADSPADDPPADDPQRAD